MSKQTKPYLIDANVLMQAARIYYSFQRAMPFWNALTDFANKGLIISIDKVLDEINEGDDILKEWANSDFKEYFMNTQTSEVLQKWADLIQWSSANVQYNDTAKDEFMDEANADGWVLAYAKAHDCILVTNETMRDAKIKKRIPIPNVCHPFGIECIDTFKMLDNLNFSFK